MAAPVAAATAAAAASGAATEALIYLYPSSSVAVTDDNVARMLLCRVRSASAVPVV